MFYSHEILTSRKYGVATVWLVATLGASEARRKLNKAEIQKVNVPKACETITNPETPLALRLQSNLLFGVSKVYSQQCAFVLNDAEHVRTQVRQAMDAIRAATITSSKTHLAKKDQITLSDDPNFNIELDFLVELDDLALGPRAEIPDSNLQSLPPQSTQQSVEDQIADLSQEMGVHSDDLSGGGEPFRSPSRPTGRSTFVSRQGSRLGSHEIPAEIPGGLLEDVGFTIGEDGSLQDAPVAGITNAGNDEHTGAAMNEETRASRLPSEQHQDVTTQQEQELPPLDDDFDLFPDARAFSPRRSRELNQQVLPDTITHATAQQQDFAEEEEVQAEEQSAAAPSRARRHRRALPLDAQMELRNQDITDWNINYVQHMQQDAIHRFHQRSAHTAKLNAQAWLNGAGLLGIGNLLSNVNIPPALQMFAGLNILMPSSPPDQGSPTSSKRGRPSSSPSPSRRVKPRLTSQEAEQGRFGGEEAQIPHLDGDLPAPPVDDADLPVEVGREAGTPLVDHRSSQMPWNLSRGSSVQRRFNLTGGHGSSSVVGGSLSQGMREGSIAAPSPLLGRDRREEEEELLGEETFQLPLEDTEMGDVPQGEQDESQLDSQGIRRSSLPWAVKAMDTEQLNFVAYIMDKVDEKKATNEDVQHDKVDFGEAFVPGETNKVVACQALMHILALNGKGVLNIEQDADEGFRPISMTVIQEMATT
ncbi:N terminus of Rad21 / Rec8-like protein [Elsinoe fawcettii]|nr:N terminus of Rad21 / Rec8-like protein [Elsinoe fawcettii]